MKLLDLFCGAGGCAVGYHRAGFTEIVGVDVRPQKRYPFAFVEGDALQYLAAHGHEYDAIHASPPCQRYSRAAFMHTNHRHPDLLGPTRSLLEASGKLWVIENVDGAPMQSPAVRLCGLMFGLKVFRHRWFETNWLLFGQSHPSHAGKLIGRDGMCCVVGHGGGVSRRMRDQMARNRHGCGGQQGKADWARAMGIDWMSRDELAQAIPPAYTEYIGTQFIEAIRAVRAAKGVAA